MVKFGGHIEALSHGDLSSSNTFLVPYNQIKKLIFENPDEFVSAWQNALKSAEKNFREDRSALWQTVFDKIATEAESEEVRGSHPGNALQLYVQNVHIDKARELHVEMRRILQTGQTNSEALRKLVKKFDKQGGQLSSVLLPKLYTCSLYAGQHMLQSGLGLFRDLLDDSSSEFKPLVKHDSETMHERSVENRMEEIDWLRRLVQSIQRFGLLNRLVAHRGFHHIRDRNDKRPIENSLSAYEIAWTSGIQLCECDIAMTKDEKLVLAHDENFMRLALDSKDPSSTRHVSDLTFRELLGLPLKSGVRPALLIDVLRSASAISPDARLVIEIKPGNQNAASALALLLVRHPDLCRSVAMIMSFDAVTMHRLRAELRIIDEGEEQSLKNAHPSGTMHNRVNSFDHFGTMHNRVNSFDQYAMLGSHSQLLSLESHQHAVGLSLSNANLEYLHNTSDPAHPYHETQEEVPISPIRQRTSSIPKLMLLTVAAPPKRPCEYRVSVDDLSPVDHWLKGPDGELDGVYLQFEKSMMTPDGAMHLKELSERYCVGIWFYSGHDPDDFQTFEWLAKEGNCTYVNTDLPNHFRRDVVVRSNRSGL
jgi:glycerophosphoryl diester phosphodiesterase